MTNVANKSEDNDENGEKRGKRRGRGKKWKIKTKILFLFFVILLDFYKKIEICIELFLLLLLLLLLLFSSSSSYLPPKCECGNSAVLREVSSSFSSSFLLILSSIKQIPVSASSHSFESLLLLSSLSPSSSVSSSSSSSFSLFFILNLFRRRSLLFSSLHPLKSSSSSFSSSFSSSSSSFSFRPLKSSSSSSSFSSSSFSSSSSSSSSFSLRPLKSSSSSSSSSLVSRHTSLFVFFPFSSSSSFFSISSRHNHKLQHNISPLSSHISTISSNDNSSNHSSSLRNDTECSSSPSSPSSGVSLLIDATDRLRPFHTPYDLLHLLPSFNLPPPPSSSFSSSSSSSSSSSVSYSGKLGGIYYGSTWCDYCKAITHVLENFPVKDFSNISSSSSSNSNNSSNMIYNKTIDDNDTISIITSSSSSSSPPINSSNDVVGDYKQNIYKPAPIRLIEKLRKIEEMNRPKIPLPPLPSSSLPLFIFVKLSNSIVGAVGPEARRRQFRMIHNQRQLRHHENCLRLMVDQNILGGRGDLPTLQLFLHSRGEDAAAAAAAAAATPVVPLMEMRKVTPERLKLFLENKTELAKIRNTSEDAADFLLRLAPLVEEEYNRIIDAYPKPQRFQYFRPHQKRRF